MVNYVHLFFVPRWLRSVSIWKADPEDSFDTVKIKSIALQVGLPTSDILKIDILKRENFTRIKIYKSTTAQWV
jgi:hypothetical protein